jgi:hypothetical protein
MEQRKVVVMFEKGETFEVEEVTFEAIEVLEQTEAPAFGIFCGAGCWGIGCVG